MKLLRSPIPRRLAGWLALWCGLAIEPVSFCRAAVSPPGENDFKGVGLCRFAAHGFAMTAQTETAINESVRKLLERHQAVFKFNRRPDFRLRMRVFGSYDDYTNATFRFYWTNAADLRALEGRPFKVAGFYTSATKEIVTWRQQMPGFLGTTLLHEAGHAIMDAHYERVPLWMLEGSAEYFAFALHPPGELHQRLLRQRWTRLKEWQRDGALLPIETLLKADSAGFKSLEPEKAYVMSWSIFQFLMSSDANQRMMLAILREWQNSNEEPPDSVRQIERLHPGGLKTFEASWHRWIRTVSATPKVSNEAPRQLP
jgi:hypothetical protein